MAIDIPYKNLPPAINGVIRNAVGQALDQVAGPNVGQYVPGIEDLIADFSIEKIRELPGNFTGQLPGVLGDRLDALIADQVDKLPFSVPVPDGIGNTIADLIARAMRNSPVLGGSGSGRPGLPPRSEWPPGQMPIPLPGGGWTFIPDPNLRRPGRIRDRIDAGRGEGPITGSGLPAPDAPRLPKRPLRDGGGGGKKSSALPLLIGIVGLGAVVVMAGKK